MNKATDQHTKVVSWIFWAWNPSSQDTGGIVSPAGKGAPYPWLTVQWLKIDKLVMLGLKPWFYGP